MTKSPHFLSFSPSFSLSRWHFEHTHLSWLSRNRSGMIFYFFIHEFFAPSRRAAALASSRVVKNKTKKFVEAISSSLNWSLISQSEYTQFILFPSASQRALEKWRSLLWCWCTAGCSNSMIPVMNRISLKWVENSNIIMSLIFDPVFSRFSSPVCDDDERLLLFCMIHAERRRWAKELNVFADDGESATPSMMM